MITGEMLLLQLMEECNEISQRVSKALRFGLEEKQPRQDHTNRERIVDELVDQKAVLELLIEEGIFKEENIIASMSKTNIEARKLKIKHYLEYSRSCGRLTDE